MTSIAFRSRSQPVLKSIGAPTRSPCMDADWLSFAEPLNISRKNRSCLQWVVPKHTDHTGFLPVLPVMRHAAWWCWQSLQFCRWSCCAGIAVFWALANAAGSRGTSTSSTGLRSFWTLLTLTFTILVPRSTPTILPSIETNFPLVRFPPWEPSDLSWIYLRSSNRRKFRSQTSDNMDRWNQSRAEAERRERWEERRVEEKESEERRCRCAKR